VQDSVSSSVGRGASIAVAVETILFAVSLVFGLFDRTELGPISGYVVCIFLAASIVVMMVAAGAAPAARVASRLAEAAAILYAPLCIVTYFLQLAVVVTNPLGLSDDTLKLIAFVPGSPTFALDMLGYTFLCLSTLAAAFALTDPRDRALRVLCIIHGALALPTLAAPVMSSLFRSTAGQSNDVGSYVLLFWCALFVPIPILFARRFRRDAARPPATAPSARA
jgi:hypothetical protein